MRQLIIYFGSNHLTYSQAALFLILLLIKIEENIKMSLVSLLLNNIYPIKTKML